MGKTLGLGSCQSWTSPSFVEGEIRGMVETSQEKVKFKQGVVFFLLKTSLTEIRPWQYEAQKSRHCAWIYHKTGTFEQKYEKMTIVTKTTNWSFVWIIFQGWQVLYSEVLEKDWKEKHDDWLKRFKGLFFAVVWNFDCTIW